MSKQISNLGGAKNMLGDAWQSKSRAQQCIESHDFSGAMGAAQHSIELSIKSLYRLVGVEPPYTHDASMIRKDGKIEDRFAEVLDSLDFGRFDYLIKDLCRCRWVAIMYAFANTTAVYGYIKIAAKDLFEVKDAEIAASYADQVYSRCSHAVGLFENNHIRMRT